MSLDKWHLIILDIQMSFKMTKMLDICTFRWQYVIQDEEKSSEVQKV
tara:strand:- start:693 stop:833 length:141 start_codon:yes stop_codon:yes gene_type:complete